MEVAPNLDPEDCREGGPELVFVKSEADPDGVPRHTYRLAEPLENATRYFFRLRVTY